MRSRRIGVGEALDMIRSGAAALILGIDKMPILFPVRDQIWVNAGFMEQLVIYELCEYAPSPTNGIYINWRTTVDRNLAAASMPPAQ